MQFQFIINYNLTRKHLDARITRIIEKYNSSNFQEIKKQLANSNCVVENCQRETKVYTMDFDLSLELKRKLNSFLTGNWKAASDAAYEIDETFKLNKIFITDIMDKSNYEEIRTRSNQSVKIVEKTTAIPSYSIFKPHYAGNTATSRRGGLALNDEYGASSRNDCQAPSTSRQTGLQFEDEYGASANPRKEFQRPSFSKCCGVGVDEEYEAKTGKVPIYDNIFKGNSQELFDWADIEALKDNQEQEQPENLASALLQPFKPQEDNAILPEIENITPTSDYQWQEEIIEISYDPCKEITKFFRTVAFMSPAVISFQEKDKSDTKQTLEINFYDDEIAEFFLKKLKKFSYEGWKFDYSFFTIKRSSYRILENIQDVTNQ